MCKEAGEDPGEVGEAERREKSQGHGRSGFNGVLGTEAVGAARGEEAG